VGTLAARYVLLLLTLMLAAVVVIEVVRLATHS
jgi:hypothetical protein